uniref:Endoplasmic reticulum transmembrane protein n=1 Tax=Steinernema glaseri TaxID=37863 RepID=A0A1I7Z4G2_9BILA
MDSNTTRILALCREQRPLALTAIFTIVLPAGIQKAPPSPTEYKQDDPRENRSESRLFLSERVSYASTENEQDEPRVNTESSTSEKKERGEKESKRSEWSLHRSDDYRSLAVNFFFVPTPVMPPSSVSLYHLTRQRQYLILNGVFRGPHDKMMDQIPFVVVLVASHNDIQQTLESKAIVHSTPLPFLGAASQSSCRSLMQQGLSSLFHAYVCYEDADQAGGTPSPCILIWLSRSLEVRSVVAFSPSRASPIPIPCPLILYIQVEHTRHVGRRGSAELPLHFLTPWPKGTKADFFAPRFLYNPTGAVGERFPTLLPDQQAERVEPSQDHREKTTRGAFFKVRQDREHQYPHGLRPNPQRLRIRQLHLARSPEEGGYKAVSIVVFNHYFPNCVCFLRLVLSQTMSIALLEAAYIFAKQMSKPLSDYVMRYGKNNPAIRNRVLIPMGTKIANVVTMVQMKKIGMGRPSTLPEVTEPVALERASEVVQQAVIFTYSLGLYVIYYGITTMIEQKKAKTHEENEVKKNSDFEARILAKVDRQLSSAFYALHQFKKALYLVRGHLQAPKRQEKNPRKKEQEVSQKDEVQILSPSKSKLIGTPGRFRRSGEHQPEEK